MYADQHTPALHPLQEAAWGRIDQVAGLAFDVNVDLADAIMLGGEELVFQGQGVGVVGFEAVVPEACGEGVAEAEDAELGCVWIH